MKLKLLWMDAYCLLAELWLVAVNTLVVCFTLSGGGGEMAAKLDYPFVTL